MRPCGSMLALHWTLKCRNKSLVRTCTVLYSTASSIRDSWIALSTEDQDNHNPHRRHIKVWELPLKTSTMKFTGRVAALLLLGLLLCSSCNATPQVAEREAPDTPALTSDLMSMMSHFWEMLVASGMGMEEASMGGPPTTVAEALDVAPGNVSILVNAVKRADIQQTIADPNLKATIFAPTNIAFVTALAKLKLTPVQLYADETKLLDILSYHTIAGKALSAGDLSDGQQLTTVNQHPLTVHVDKVAGTSIQGATETAKVVAADIKAGQAIIHVVDTVLLPPVAPS